ncbi:heavy metal-binding HIP-like [Paramuricea clavata]|uniref:Heavy metal-binding HIP-like n=1 Tax=Paramuricea clavata TaxID=317549 RepID=A0A7D9JK55_PARCT|nr:heavy metal-binding HIP-like [Paramuricea clavata]
MLSVSFVLFACFVLVLTGHFGACNVLRETASDERVKRGVNTPGGGITLNFEKGMRDFIVNGKGVGIHGQVLVAFQATLTTGRIGPNYAHGAIKFNDVALNIGSGYNPSTGLFTAPIGGIYQFTATYLQQSGYQSHVRLIKGSATIISDIHANHKNYDQLTKTVLVALAKGETFWVKLEKSSAYAVYGTQRYTQFGGFLLSANYK